MVTLQIFLEEKKKDWQTGNLMQSKPPEIFYVVKILNDLTTTDQCD